MIFNVFQAAIGAFFMVMSVHPDAKFGKRGQGGPLSGTARVLFCVIGLVTVIDAVIKVFGGSGLEVSFH